MKPQLLFGVWILTVCGTLSANEYAWGLPRAEIWSPPDSVRWLIPDSLDGTTVYLPDSVSQFYPGEPGGKGDAYVFYRDRGEGYGVYDPIDVVYILENTAPLQHDDQALQRVEMLEQLLLRQTGYDSLHYARLGTAGFISCAAAVSHPIPSLNVSTGNPSKAGHLATIRDAIGQSVAAAANGGSTLNITPALRMAHGWLDSCGVSPRRIIVIVSTGNFADDEQWQAYLDECAAMADSAPRIWGIVLGADSVNNDLFTLARAGGGDACLFTDAPRNAGFIPYDGAVGDATHRLSFDNICLINQSLPTPDTIVPDTASMQTVFPMMVSRFSFNRPLPLRAGRNALAVTFSEYDGFAQTRQTITRRFAIVIDTTGEYRERYPSGALIPLSVAVAPARANARPAQALTPVVSGLSTADGLLVRYSLPASAPVRLALYDAHGRIIRQRPLGIQAAGSHELVLPTRGLARGVYFVGVNGTIAAHGIGLLR
jgi:hypothetical protein